jgi:mono/diheme cytochrome c family protein
MIRMSVIAMLFAMFAPAFVSDSAAQPPASEAPRARSPEQLQPFLTQHCADCHDTDNPEGQFHLNELSGEFASSRVRWEMVYQKLTTGAMPPPTLPRPAGAEVRRLTDWIAGRIGEEDAEHRAARGRVVLRRLNRVEFANTLRDLLGITLDISDTLALDGASAGFDNVGAALHLSSFALERYLEAVDAALDVAIANRSQPAKVQERFSIKNHHVVRNDQSSQYFQVLDDDTVVCYSSVWPSVSLLQLNLWQRGEYRIRMAASGHNTDGKPVTFEIRSSTDGLIGYFDVPADEPTEIEFSTRIEIGRTGASGVNLMPYGIGRGEPPVAGDPDHRHGVAIHWVEVEGPLFDSWPPECHHHIFGDLEMRHSGSGDALEVVPSDPVADGERIVGNFARRALRRSLSDEDIGPFLTLFNERLAEGDSFDSAVRVALVAVMTSPKFLFLDEKPGKLDDFAIASRLSYFLWSTMPDDALIALAEEKLLSHPDVLYAQVERMLASPKAASFIKNFCGQWLGLRDIDFTAPHHGLYPEFDEMLKVSMVKEAELFFAEVLRDDLSLLNFVSSDFSMLNGRLAQHYEIPGVEGLWEFRKVSLPAASPRGGVMTMAAPLKVSANGTTTSPITRGAWVLERILGTPPPPPPGDIPVLEPDIRGATTIREQLEKHRNSPACNSCHAMIDPPGFALESFDVIGGWRTYYRQMNWTRTTKEVPGHRYLQGPDVDPNGVTADGEAFDNVARFKELLLRDKDQIARALTQKLVTYATGGPAEIADQPEINAIVDRIGDKDYGLKTLVHEIVRSRMFQEK